MAFLYAAFAAVIWGSYLVPYKKVKANIYYSQLLMCIGIFLSSIIISVVLEFPWSITIFGILGGIIWTIGNYFSLSAIEKIGMSRAFPLWTANTLVAFSWGVVVFKELTSTSIIFGLLGVLFIFTGCFFIGRTKKEEEKSNIIGILFALLAAVFFGSVMVPLKIAELSAEEYFLQMSWGILFSSILIFLLNREIPSKLYLGKGLMSGILWGLGNFFGTFAIFMLGLSRGVPMTQLSVLVGTSWALFYFKEFDKKKQIVRIIISTLVIITGAFFVSLAGG